MNSMNSFSAEQSGAFIERFTFPPTRSGPLDGLSFAVKDLIDVAGHHTGCGNPTWLATHPRATDHAICVEQLLAAGARCEGKTVTDEIAFSLLGENHFYGTPLNPAAPDRVPGGSSSGSASAVACGLVDFALGTDTGGSVRVPASNCGIWGLRPSHGLISVAGVMPLSPTLDTVGIFARDVDVLKRVASVLLPGDGDTASVSTMSTIHLVQEPFMSADADVQSALSEPISKLQETLSVRVRQSSLGELCGDADAADLDTWLTIYRVLQGTEMMSCLGGWIDAAEPTLGPAPRAGLEFVRKLDRSRIGESVARRERYCRRLNKALGPGDLLCIPTAPAVAPLKGSRAYDRTSTYYRHTLSMTAIAGVGRLPQISMPVAHVGGAPIGLSLLAAHGLDLELVKMAKQVAAISATNPSAV
jgi:amidase